METTKMEKNAEQECQDTARKLRGEVNADTITGSVMWGKGKMKALAELIHELEKLESKTI